MMSERQLGSPTFCAAYTLAVRLSGPDFGAGWRGQQHSDWCWLTGVIARREIEHTVHERLLQVHPYERWELFVLEQSKQGRSPTAVLISPFAYPRRGTLFLVA